MRRRSTIKYVSVEIDAADVFAELSVDEVRDLAEARGICLPYSEPSFDLIEEIRTELIGGRVQSALALIESHCRAKQVSDAERQREFQRAGLRH